MKSYKIKTLQDIVKAVDANNIDGFLKDFELWLKMTVEAKKMNIPGVELANSTFTWNDDNENGVLKGIDIDIDFK